MNLKKSILAVLTCIVFWLVALPDAAAVISGVSYMQIYAGSDNVGEYDVELDVETDSSIVAAWGEAPFGSFTCNKEGDGNWEYYEEWPLSTPPTVDGDWTITVSNASGQIASTVIPFAQTDGITPILEVTTCPNLTTPSVENGMLQVSESLVWAWDSHFDSNATHAEIGYWNSITDEDTNIVFSGGDLSLLSSGPFALPPGTEEIWILNYVKREGVNADGIDYEVGKYVEHDYDIVVVGGIAIDVAYGLEEDAYFAQIEVHHEMGMDSSVTAIEGDAPFGHFVCSPEESMWFFENEWSPGAPLPNVDGDWTITATFDNGKTASTVIPFAQADGVTPLANMTTCPQLISPNVAGGGTVQAFALLNWKWDSHFDSNATHGVIGYSYGATHDDARVFLSGTDLSLLSYGPFPLPAEAVDILIGSIAMHEGANADGIKFRVKKLAGYEYDVVVVPNSADPDFDGLPSEWEQQYFGDSTNANPSAVCSNGVNTVLDAYIAGFDPTDPSAGFYAAEDVQSGDVVIEWPCTSNRTYSVYWTTNLVDGFELIQRFVRVIHRYRASDGKHRILQN